ncbi:phosphoadenosine phosphosulfate reductase family protein [Mesorhizobium sp.]|uniref:phosphoadenosine phosphosulfate reductase domain-containing protein n=1 Tax=Mesorhizobium sp. TaxID=1871066 RepID=UPI00257ABFF6|nr:phosphoadenosine phosphosulfate reductase family protein [Mesorhizobium sp.]
MNATNDNERRLVISFSGGETSAMMTALIHARMAGEYDAIRCVFANTGQENEQTLEFVRRCDEAFGLGVVWVEAEINPVRGEGVRGRAVTFDTAARDGRPFEDVIRKHGIPNKMWPHCTRELKARPIKAWLSANGWRPGSYDLAIGIRRDEIDRMSPNAKAERIIYPLVSRFPASKADVNAFWERQPFRLELKGYQGNCKWCWKKSLRKHLTIISETPEAYDFPERMEREYALAGNNPNGEPRVFFREERSVADLRRIAATTLFRPASDDARHYQRELFSFEMDAADGCEESCEVDFGDETVANAA